MIFFSYVILNIIPIRLTIAGVNFQDRSNQACCYALENDLDKTIEFLEKSRQIDEQKTLDSLKTDSDFEKIRHNSKLIEWIKPK